MRAAGTPASRPTTHTSTAAASGRLPARATASGSPTSSARGATSSARRAASAAAAASPGARSASTSPRSWPRSARDGRSTCTRLRTCSPTRRCSPGSRPTHLTLIAGCAQNVGFDAGRAALPRGRARRHLLPRPPRPRRARDCTRPARGAVVIETIETGEVVGWSWLFPPYRWHFDARALDDRARARLRRRLPPRQVRGRPGARLRADEALRAGASSTAWSATGCGCSTSMAASAPAEPPCAAP